MKIYIADDDIILVEGLKKIIEEGCPFGKVIGVGHNGLQVLEDIKSMQPDLLITDIKMPVMDGVELVKRVKELFDCIKVIIISGYDEYSYIRNTMKYGAADYLLKPVENDDLLELINKIKNDLDKEKENKRQMLLFSKRINESLAALKEKALLDLIKGNGKNTEYIERRLSEYGIKGSGLYYMAFFSINQHNPNNSTFITVPDPGIIMMVVDRYLDGAEIEVDALGALVESGAVFLFIGDPSSENSFQPALISILENIRTSLANEYGLLVSIGLSEKFASLDRAGIAFQHGYHDSLLVK
ncbi:MAG TPA: response regulator [Clostridiaceae bacterium]|nr:response regulator [Clostridiaceae bacterium]